MSITSTSSPLPPNPGVFDESILPLAHLEGTLTRMLTCLPRPEVAAARKQGELAGVGERFLQRAVL